MPAKTIKAGRHSVPCGENMIRYLDGSLRYFTVYEGKLLQIFSPEFVVTGAWGEAMRQIGNAVPKQPAKNNGLKLFESIRGSQNEARKLVNICAAA